MNYNIGAGGHKELRADRKRTADLNWPKGYSFPSCGEKKQQTTKLRGVGWGAALKDTVPFQSRTLKR